MKTLADTYINHIRNSKKKAFAISFKEALHSNTPLPHFKQFGLSLMAGQAVELNLQRHHVEKEAL